MHNTFKLHNFVGEIGSSYNINKPARGLPKNPLAFYLLYPKLIRIFRPKIVFYEYFDI